MNERTCHQLKMTSTFASASARRTCASVSRRSMRDVSSTSKFPAGTLLKKSDTAQNMSSSRPSFEEEGHFRINEAPQLSRTEPQLRTMPKKATLKSKTTPVMLPATQTIRQSQSLRIVLANLLAITFHDCRDLHLRLNSNI